MEGECKDRGDSGVANRAFKGKTATGEATALLVRVWEEFLDDLGGGKLLVLTVREKFCHSIGSALPKRAKISVLQSLK